MTSTGWLDVHGHFSLPQTDHQRRETYQAFRAADFWIDDNWRWTTDDSLKYMDEAGIQMLMLSYIPRKLSALKQANDFGASLVRQHPTRLGFLAALPHDDPRECLAEIDRALQELNADGFALSTTLNGVKLSDPSVEPVWRRLNDLHAVVFVHPDTATPPRDGRTAALVEVTLETTRVVIDMIYRKLLLRFPEVKVILAHAGGVLPMLAGRLELLGAEPWVLNPDGLTKKEITIQLQKLYLDTAASAKTGLLPAAEMVGWEHMVYGADCGPPCSTPSTMNENKADAVQVLKRFGKDADLIGRNGWHLFPTAAKRAGTV